MVIIWNLKNGLTWKSLLDEVKNDMEKYGIVFTSLKYDDYFNYKDELILWYKNYIGKEPQDDGEFVGWYRIMQSYIFENLTYDQALIIGVTEEDFKNGLLNEEDIVVIQGDKLYEAIDQNLMYIFSFSW